MSAASARRRKQLAARSAGEGGHGAVLKKLEQALEAPNMDETTAYEALQLAQSIIRKRIKQGDFDAACVLCSDTSLRLLQSNRVSVASQLLSLLVEALRETHMVDSQEWIDRIVALQAAHDSAMDATFSGDAASSIEALRLARLQRDWLRDVTHWSSDFGKIHYGANVFHELFAQQSHRLAMMLTGSSSTSSNNATNDNDDDDANERVEAWCDAVQHMALAEQPDKIVAWLATLPAPTDVESALGHLCAPALRDSLLTRTVLLLAAIENLRDANQLVRGYINQVEEPSGRTMAALVKSYTSKDDGKAPTHVVFCCMLLRVLEKDASAGPLYSWLLRSFKKELEKLPKPQVGLGFTTKIGQKFFNMQPPPNMLSMVENMMGMMGGGGGGGGINPAMMQAAFAQMQGGMM
ncbi:hypothetical protein MPSEU_000923100 [Mayamaea pseudoterrestris]|nr:hypothetical protein MPSEU_000923100 [Mayamaea pseudoterrestris]